MAHQTACRSLTVRQVGRLGYRQVLFRAYSKVPGDEMKKDTKPERVLDNGGHGTLEDKPKITPEPQSLDDIKNLPSEEESKRSEFSKWMVEKLDKLQTTVFTAGQTLNDFTGYSSIEKLKKSIEDQEQVTTQSRDLVRQCKEQYASAISNRSASQREVNELLQRKHAWSPVDLERFTELYRNDHANQHSETKAEEMLNAAEVALETSQSQMTRLISARYHEEQIWSDKIRRASTWGTWALMGFNIFLFIVVQLGLEPWKRKRLVGSFEEKVKSALESDKQSRVLISKENQEHYEMSSNDKERLDRLEQLAAAESQALQVLSSALLTQPVLETPPSEHSATNLTWRSFPERLLSSMDTASNVAVCRPEEIVGMTGLGVAIGLLVGSLITLIARG